MTERLQKFLSAAGIASRRHAEDLIKAGKVKVNGQVVREMGVKVDPAKDEVRVDNKKVKPVAQLIYLAFNKPKRCMTTRDDPRKRKTVFDFLPPELRNAVWPIGRLDFNTEGLLLFTNDGDLTHRLTHPSFEHEKEYEVQLDKELSSGRVEKIEGGMDIDGKRTAPAKLRLQGTTVYLTIHEGMNRQVRKMFGELGYSVRNLKRVRIGKLKLADIPSGGYVAFDPAKLF
jgi:23S rRNA pseudouridine2605 synthase